jgi:hypothetical protein
LPLIPQQDIVSVYVQAKWDTGLAIVALKKKLDPYPPCRIISVSNHVSPNGNVTLTAVIETL